MKRMKKLFAVVILMPLLGACAVVDLDEVAGLEQMGDTYFQALHREYVQLARTEAVEGDWGDAEYFASKARAAAAGEYQGPQALEERDLPADSILELSLARSLLVEALNTRRDGNPHAAGRAQAMVDCWMQEQEENFQPDHIEACKTDFTIAYEALVYERPTAAAPMAEEVMQAGPFMVFFGFDSDALDKAALALIENVAKHPIAQDGDALITISGHADRSGNKDYNMALSEQRAISVSLAMQLSGVSAKVAMQHFGEESPLKATDDGVREPKNRRVEILLTK